MRGYRGLCGSVSRPRSFCTICCTLASSCVPSTWECEARICSSRVEPERGNPTMNMESASGEPTPRRAAKNSAVHTAICSRVLFSMISGRYRLCARFKALPIRYCSKEPGYSPAVLERPAQRECQVHPVDLPCGRRFRRGPHARHLLRREAIGLEVRETPIRVPEIRTTRRRPAVGADGLLPAAERLLRVGDREVQFGILGRSLQQLAVQAHRPLVLAESHAARGIQRLEQGVVGFAFEQHGEFPPRLAVLVHLQQHLGIFTARRMVGGRQFEHGREQQLGVVQHLAHHADPGQQPHAFDVVALAQEVGADQGLSRIHVAVREQPRCRHHFRRKLLQYRHMAGGHGGVVGLARHAVEPLEYAPAGRQGMVEVHRPKKGVDGPRRLPQHDETMSALLVQPAEVRMMPLQLLQGRQRIAHLSEKTSRDRRDQQHVALSRLARQRVSGRREGLGKLLPRKQSPNPTYLVGVHGIQMSAPRTHTMKAAEAHQ